MKKINLTIDGMSCGHCVQSVRSALESVPGATVASVEIGTATVLVDESRTAIGDLVDAVQDAGYEAQEATA
ncbi:MAG TPA: heavy-metal-associated domain-containing protein [Gemmatimonadaceae bacterium]|nr:heavy-metal-associated domain-containing protein [Gemmatimonadaceae bacterium]